MALYALVRMDAPDATEAVVLSTYKDLGRAEEALDKKLKEQKRRNSTTSRAREDDPTYVYRLAIAPDTQVRPWDKFPVVEMETET